MTFPAHRHRGHPVNVPIRRMMHLSSVIPANDTRESVFGNQNFPRRERGSNLGPFKDYYEFIKQESTLKFNILNKSDSSVVTSGQALASGARSPRFDPHFVKQASLFLLAYVHRDVAVLIGG